MDLLFLIIWFLDNKSRACIEAKIFSNRILIRKIYLVILNCHLLNFWNYDYINPSVTKWVKSSRFLVSIFWNFLAYSDHSWGRHRFDVCHQKIKKKFENFFLQKFFSALKNTLKSSQHKKIKRKKNLGQIGLQCFTPDR